MLYDLVIVYTDFLGDYDSISYDNLEAAIEGAKLFWGFMTPSLRPHVHLYVFDVLAKSFPTAYGLCQFDVSADNPSDPSGICPLNYLGWITDYVTLKTFCRKLNLKQYGGV